MSLDNTEVTRKIPRKYLYRKSLVPTQQQLESMQLMHGQNEIIFEVEVGGFRENIYYLIIYIHIYSYILIYIHIYSYMYILLCITQGLSMHRVRKWFMTLTPYAN
jgi:hypothetical protein